MKYKHILFDLDRTLWDFEKNAEQTFREIYTDYKLHLLFESFDSFLKTYRDINENLWHQYREGKIEKEVLRYKRFNDTLKQIGFENKTLAKKIGDDYVFNSPQKKALFPNAHHVLKYLSKKYILHIVTNGFKEVQKVKMKNTNIDIYFNHIFISEEIGFQKPHPEIFKHILNKIQAKPSECLMIGDDPEVDIIGAKNAGIDQVLFNTTDKKVLQNPSYEIKDLSELKQIL